jgi:hypothetical protein
MPGSDSAGRLGKALMLAELAGIDPNAFGGTDLVARLAATLGDFEPGLYGAAHPGFDGVFRQGLAVVGLVAVGAPVPGSAVQWLVDQQCDGANPAAQGGWQAYRANLALPCDSPDGTLFIGPDTNSTALAVQALEAAGSAPGDDPLDFLDTYQEPDGGWAFIPGSGTDPSSTGLVIQALLAAGEDPADWLVGGDDPHDALLAFQIGCDDVEAERGAFEAPFNPDTPSVFATTQSVPALAGVAFPQDGPADLLLGAPPVDCSPDDPDDPADPADGQDPTTPTSAGLPRVSAPPASPAAATSAQPSVTG